VQATGSHGLITWDAAPSGGFNWLSLNPVDIGPSPTAARAVSAHLTTANATACTTSPGPDAVGCGHARASRTLGDAIFGGVGSGGGYTYGSWAVTGLTEDAYAESGSGHRAPSYSRSGTLYYYKASAPSQYASLSLTAATAGTYIADDITRSFTVPSGGTITVKVSSKVTVTAATLTSDDAVDPTCKLNACSYAAKDTQGILGQTTYVISFTSGGVTTELSSFVVVANLGGLIAQSSMKVAS
jgi:hypothetical protein